MSLLINILYKNYSVIYILIMNILSNQAIASRAMNDKAPLRFIDLFAGLGGIHHGLVKAGGYKCVFASEIDTELAEIYEKNFGIVPAGDIKNISAHDVPPHDVMCAGFPCQPFSLAGKKSGVECDVSGRLIYEIIRLLRYHRPTFVLLENVPNIRTIHEGAFWIFLERAFEEIGYTLTTKVLSTQDFGIPQHRDRLFIVGSIDPVKLNRFFWPRPTKGGKVSIISDTTSDKKYKNLESAKKNQLSVWQELLDYLDIGLSCTHSIVAPEFGANYPYDFAKLTLREMKTFKGAYGKALDDCTSWKNIMERMPTYTRKNRCVPQWMRSSVSHSRKIYDANQTFIDEWKFRLNRDFASWQILEWRGLDYDNNVRSHLIQFRASGIRISKPDKVPALVAMTPTQIPIIGSQMRYLSVDEAAKLQDLSELINLPHTTARAFKALGNSVNAGLVSMVARNIRKAHLQL